MIPRTFTTKDIKDTKVFISFAFVSIVSFVVGGWIFTWDR